MSRNELKQQKLASWLGAQKEPEAAAAYAAAAAVDPF